VEESANGKAGISLREADLERHLLNDNEKGSEAKSEKPEASVSQEEKTTTQKNDKKKKADENEDESRKPFEYGSKDDHQLSQAVNLLKALQILKR